MTNEIEEVKTIEHEGQKQPALPKGFRLLFILIIATWVVVGGLVGTNIYMTKNQPKPVSQPTINIPALENQLNSLNSRIDELNEKVNQPELEVAPSAEEERRFEGASFDAQAVTESISEVGSRTAALEDKIGKLDDNIAQKKTYEKTNMALVATVKLRDSVKNNQPFFYELATLKPFAASDELINENLAVLEKSAQTGVKTLKALQQEFAVVSDKIINEARKTKYKPGFVATAVIQFSGLVHVKKIDASGTGLDPEDVIARADKNLANADIEGAIKEVKYLDSYSLILAKQWISDAEASVGAIKASETIFQHVTAPSYVNADSN